jgi:hypothetical protein
MSDRPTYRLEIRSRPSDYPEAVRLRHVLKALLRRYDFVCTSVEEVKPAAPAAPAAAKGEGEPCR